MDGLLLTQVMTNVVEVALQEYLSLLFSLNHHLSLLLLLGAHIVQPTL